MVYKRGNRRAKRQAVKPSRRFTKLVKKVITKVAEHKYSQTNVTALDFLRTGGIAGYVLGPSQLVRSLDQDLIGGIAQGVEAKHRIGDRINLISLRLRGVLVPTTATTGAVRLIVGQMIDQSTQSAMTLTQGEVLPQLSAATDYSVMTSFYDHEPTVHYRILSDEVHTWDATNTASPIVVDHLYRKFAVKVRNYEGTSQVYTGGFFYMLCSANGVACQLLYPSAELKWTDV